MDVLITYGDGKSLTLYEIPGMEEGRVWLSAKVPSGEGMRLTLPDLDYASAIHRLIPVSEQVIRRAVERAAQKALHLKIPAGCAGRDVDIDFDDLAEATRAG